MMVYIIEEESTILTGYVKPKPQEEQQEIERIIKRPLMHMGIQQIKRISKLTKTFNE